MIDNIIEDLSVDVDKEAEIDREDDKKQIKDHKDLVLEVTDQNINQFTIQDVVMPMIGHDVRLPSHEGL